MYQNRGFIFHSKNKIEGHTEGIGENHMKMATSSMYWWMGEQTKWQRLGWSLDWWPCTKEWCKKWVSAVLEKIRDCWQYIPRPATCAVFSNGARLALRRIGTHTKLNFGKNGLHFARVCCSCSYLAPNAYKTAWTFFYTKFLIQSKSLHICDWLFDLLHVIIIHRHVIGF